MARYYSVREIKDGVIACEETEVKPKNGKNFSYDEMKEFVGYPVEIVPLPSGKSIVVNENGKLDGLKYNQLASDAWKKEYPIADYPINNDELVVGNALICTDKELENNEE